MSASIVNHNALNEANFMAIGKNEKNVPQKRHGPKRRAVACKSCHSLKVKCIPSDPEDLSSPCVRCIKTKRSCEIDLNQTRKKRKPDDRVSELESKIVSLTNQLHQQHQVSSKHGITASPRSTGSGSNHGSPHPLAHTANTGGVHAPNFSKFNVSSNGYPPTKNTKGKAPPQSKTGPHSLEFVIENDQFNSHPSSKSNSKKSTPTSTTLAQSSLNATDPSCSPNSSHNHYRDTRATSRAQQIDELIGTNILTEISNSVSSTIEARYQKVVQEHVDIIDKGLITIEEAKARLAIYETSVFTKYPFVKLPQDFDSFRKSQPILFVTVMAVTGTFEPSIDDSPVDRDLELEVLALKQSVNDFLIVGKKSIELLKSLLLLSIWYNTPELFHHRRYHIISSLCLNMAQDLGLSGNPYYMVNKSDGTIRKGSSLDDLETTEYKALSFGVYCASVGFCLFLRRRLQVHWSPCMETSYHTLMSLQDDRLKNVALLGKLTSLMERIHTHVDASTESNLMLIDVFQQEINGLKSETNTINKDVYFGFISSIEAFLFSKFSSTEFSVKCYHACGKCIEHYARLTPQESVSVPILLFGRLMYCFALFLKITNILKLDLDVKLIKRLLDSLEKTYSEYKKNHMVIKTRLLFYFYLTTYAKDEHVFNDVTDVMSTDSVAKSVIDHQEKMRNGELHTSQSEPKLNNLSFQMSRLGSEPMPFLQSAPQYSQIRFQNDSYQQQQQPHQTTDSEAAQSNIPTSRAGYGRISAFNEQVLQPQQSSGVEESQQYHDEQGSNFFGALDGQNGDPSYPLLDMLSGVTMKGFNDFSNDYLKNQDEFWKIFDYKDDQQFFL